MGVPPCWSGGARPMRRPPSNASPVRLIPATIRGRGGRRRVSRATIVRAPGALRRRTFPHRAGLFKYEIATKR
ncbi:hypothetical protein GCM10009605_28420 [Nocardiopsis composta]